MIGILVATHGDFSKGLLNAVELVYGKQEQVETIGLYHGDGVEEFEEHMKELLAKLDTGDGVLALADMVAGTPGNTIMRLLPQYENLRAIAGVNMPMLITAVSERDEAESLDELCKTCLEIGVQETVSMYERYKEILENEGTEDDEDF